MSDDPIERRRRQRDASRRKTLTIAIIGGGLVVGGMLVAAAVLLRGKDGGGFGGRTGPELITSDDQLVVGETITMEGEVLIASARAAEPAINHRATVVVIIKSPGGKRITCAFPEEAFNERWHRDTERGDLFTVTGRVDEVNARTARLVDCKFVRQVLRK